MPRAHRVSEGHVAFWCPGCDSAHMIKTLPGGWTFNGNFELPTIQPSVFVTGFEPITDEEHAILMSGGKVETRSLRCHSFVTNGRIQFLGDCTHALGNQTVDLPEWGGV